MSGSLFMRGGNIAPMRRSDAQSNARRPARRSPRAQAAAYSRERHPYHHAARHRVKRPASSVPRRITHSCILRPIDLRADLCLLRATKVSFQQDDSMRSQTHDISFRDAPARQSPQTQAAAYSRERRASTAYKAYGGPHAQPHRAWPPPSPYTPIRPYKKADPKRVRVCFFIVMISP